MKAAEAAPRPPVIILAGGRSSRFGSPKGVAVIDGQTLLAGHLHACYQFGTAAVVVTGHYHDVYDAEVRSVAAAVGVMAGCVRNPDPDCGPFSSLQVGLKACPSLALGVFVQPVDCGPVDAGLYQTLYGASEQGGTTVVPTANGKGGHPVFLSTALAHHCCSLPQGDDARLDLILRQQPAAALLRIETGDARIMRNINTPGAL